MMQPELVDYDLPGDGRLPQLLHRLDPQGLSRATRKQGHARDLGHGAAVAHQDGDRRGRGRRRARLRRGRLAGRRQHRSGLATSSRRAARSTSSTTRRRCMFVGGKLGLDATRTWPEEGYAREWPEVARMSDEVRRRVDERWDALGIPLAAAPRPPPREGGADGAARSGSGCEPLSRPARDSAVRRRGLARARARPPAGGDRRHARRRARLGRPTRRALAHARDDRLRLRPRSELERGRRGRRRDDRGCAARRGRRAHRPHRAARRPRRAAARRRPRPRDGGALRARDRRRRALGRAAARARRPPARDPLPRLDAPPDRPGGRRRRGARARLARGRRPPPTRTATTSRARIARATATCSRSSPRPTGGVRGSSMRASRATSSRAWRWASRRAASPRSRPWRRRCPRPRRSPAATRCSCSPGFR